MSDSFVMMALGEYRFSLATAAYQSLDRSSDWRWESVDRIGARPAKQYLGPGEDTVNMRGTIYPHFRGGLGQVEAMRTEANKGEPYLLVDGTGKVWGNYCITNVSETQETFFSNGIPRKIDFTIALAMYGDDDV